MSEALKRPSDRLAWPGALAALALSIYAARLLQQDRFPLGGLLFLIAALMLMLTKPSGAEGMSDLPRPTRPREAWEPFFVAALMVAGYFQFIWKLWDLAPGAIYSEHFHINSAMKLASGPYQAVDPAFSYWPSMYQYLGLLSVKFFGHSPGSFHLPSAIVAWITLLAFYFAMRSISTPLTAAGASLLWLGFHYNIEMAHRAYPVGLMYLPPLLILGSVAWALRTKSYWPWVGAGFGAALGIWGYYPGRAMPGILAVISVWLWVNRRRFALPRRSLMLMWGVFVLSFSPVLVNALKNSNAYWVYGQVNSPLKKGAPGDSPLKGVLHVIEYNFVPFVKMFHVKANVDAYEDDSMGRPVLDEVAQVLFPLGLALCLLSLVRAPSVYVLMVFILGMIPPLLIKMGQPPWPRRATLAFPAVFLFCGLAIEQLRQNLSLGKPRFPAWFLWVVLVAIGSVVSWQGAMHYRDYVREPVVRQFMRYAGDQLRREILANPGRQVIGSDRILQQGESGVMPPNVAPGMRGGTWIEDFVFLSPDKPHLLGMGPYLEHAVPLIKDIYPNAQVKVIRQENPEKWDWNTLYLDHFNPEVYLVRVLVDEKDILARTGLLNQDTNSAINIGDPNALRAQRGKFLRVGGMLRVDFPGMTLTAGSLWPAWNMAVDGRNMASGKSLFLEGGPHRIEMSGTVPANPGPSFGVELRAGSENMLAPTRCLAWSTPNGLDMRIWTGSEVWAKGKPEFASTLLTPVYRFNRPTVQGLFSMRVEGRLTVPEDGRYGLRLEGPSAAGIVTIDGQRVWDNFSAGPNSSLYQMPITLQKGRSYALRVDFQRNGADEIYQIFALAVSPPGSEKWVTLPYEWCRPMQRRL